MQYLLLFTLALNIQDATSAMTSCGIRVPKGRCVKVLSKDVFDTVLIADRNGFSPNLPIWNLDDESIKSLLCFCATKALAGPYLTIGIHKYNECWASRKSLKELTHLIASRYDDSGCYAKGLRPCKGDEPCAGGVNHTFIHSLDLLSSGCTSVRQVNGVDRINASEPPSSSFAKQCLVLKFISLKRHGVQWYSMEAKTVYNTLHKRIDGIIFNARDFQNFQFVSVRVGRETCVTVGLVIFGKFSKDKNFVVDNSCTSWGLWNILWHQISVKVTKEKVFVYLDWQNVAVVSSIYPPVQRGGYIVENGHFNLAQFRDFKFSY